jgi:hypothetical protein
LFFFVFIFVRPLWLLLLLLLLLLSLVLDCAIESVLPAVAAFVSFSDSTAVSFTVSPPAVSFTISPTVSSALSSGLPNFRRRRIAAICRDTSACLGDTVKGERDSVKK